jgi:hypothetical protein
MFKLSRLCRFVVLGMIFAVAVPLWGQEYQPIEGRIVSAGLFKNGLAVIHQVVEVPGPGRYRLDDPPIPRHGTWWVESDAVVETLTTEREVEIDLPDAQRLDFQRSLAGLDVEILFKGGNPTPLSGTVARIERTGPEPSWDRTYEGSAPNHWSAPLRSEPTVTRFSPASFLLLETDDGTSTYVDTSLIASLRVIGAESSGKPQVKILKPVLIFDVKEVRSTPTEISISYLAKGIAWAPSYLIDLTDPERLELRQKTVIKNELTDLHDTEIQLISGFPNISFGHVISPLSATTNWARFFQQLNQRIRPGHTATANVMTQQALAPAAGADMTPELDLSTDGFDIYYHSIGTRDLDEGDALALQTAATTAPYERIVDWVVPDTRQADGRFIDEYQRQQDPEKYDDAAWDAIRFANPLAFPMTTAAAMIVEGGQFRGQTMSSFTNPGSEVVLRITKALSLSTLAVEHEEEGERRIESIGGRTFRETGVMGELSATNHRGEAVSLLVRRRFSGELLEADHEPSVRQLEEGAYSINRRNELVWSLDIQPAESITLRYRYRVLVYH